MTDTLQLSAPPPSLDDERGSRVLRKVTLRLLPFLCLLYGLNLLDRSNVGFARRELQRDLEMSKEEFNWGFGLFYFGYLVFEVPSNLLLQRTGARRWIARIMISWGLVSCATMAVTSASSFYLVRILLGIAEAGFFPGVILYLTYWIPARERSRAMSYFMIAGPIMGAVSGPINGVIMQSLDGVLGLAGWQWLFLLEGVPSIMVGIVVLFYLTDRPEQAQWLSADERSWLVERMAREEKHLQQRHRADLGAAFASWRVWLLIALYFTVAVGANAGSAYFTELLEDQFKGWEKREIGFLVAAPQLCALVSMIGFAISSDRTGWRRLHVSLAALSAALGWSISALGISPEVTLIGFCLAQAGMMAMLPTFWALPTSFLSGAAAVGGIALINSVANIGGWFGPTILGTLGLWSMAGILCAGAVLALCVRHEPTRVD
jgi:ACS family tartrate transporter-like MFS transporter